MTPSLPKTVDDSAIIQIPAVGGVKKRNRKAPSTVAVKKTRKAAFYDPYHGAVKAIVREKDMYINAEAETRLWNNVDTMVVSVIKKSIKKAIAANKHSVTPIDVLETITDFVPAAVSNGFCKRLYNDLSEAATTSEEGVINRKIKRSEDTKERIRNGKFSLPSSSSAKQAN